jgi:16S rRNA G1207 methylase RsmC
VRRDKRLPAKAPANVAEPLRPTIIMHQTHRLRGIPIDWLPLLKSKAHAPVLVALGSPKSAADLVEQLGLEGATLFQLDLYQAAQLREELAQRKLSADVVTHADLWDCGAAHFRTVLFPVEPRGERMLKLDVIEQAYHVLRPAGAIIVLSPYERDPFFSGALKKIYGRVHCPEAGLATLLWSQRQGDRPRRRHEVAFQVRVDEARSARFLSRPGAFSYGRFDNGARALVEIASVETGESILDLGCGTGTNGILCSLRAGAQAKVTFVDSNCRAAALADLNARANGLTNFEVITAWQVNGLPQQGFDVVLANPPYYAGLTIAMRFIEESRSLLKKCGRLYLVTKQPDTLGPFMAERFGMVEPVERRGYVVLCATGHQ